MNVPLPAERVRALLRTPLQAEEARAVVLKAVIGRRIRLTPQARKEHRRRQNLKAVQARRARLLARGLTTEGQQWKRPVRERVRIIDVGFDDDGEMNVRITTPKRRLSPGMLVELKWAAQTSRSATTLRSATVGKEAA